LACLRPALLTGRRLADVSPPANLLAWRLLYIGGQLPCSAAWASNIVSACCRWPIKCLLSLRRPQFGSYVASSSSGRLMNRAGGCWSLPQVRVHVLLAALPAAAALLIANSQSTQKICLSANSKKTQHFRRCFEFVFGPHWIRPSTCESGEVAFKVRSRFDSC